MVRLAAELLLLLGLLLLTLHITVSRSSPVQPPQQEANGTLSLLDQGAVLTEVSGGGGGGDRESSHLIFFTFSPWIA